MVQGDGQFAEPAAELGGVVLYGETNGFLAALVLEEAEQSEQSLLEFQRGSLVSEGLDEVLRLNVVLDRVEVTPFKRLAMTMLNLT